MAYVATLQKTWVSGAASLVPTWVDTAAVETTTLITAFDGGNASSSTSTITGAGTTTPAIEIESRATDWRHLLFAVEGVEGKTPTFKLNRATMTDPAFTPTADFLPLWTQDFVTWTQATSRTLTGGTTGTIDFSFDAALPAGRVYVSTHPMGQNADAATFAAELLADYSSVASPTTSANTSGVYNTTPAETGDDGRAVGGNAQYAIKLAFGGSTTDGGPKRKLVMFAGIHAAGEHVSWISFVAAVRHILDAPAAANFRANWDVYLYFNVTANGIVGGERRQNPSRNIDPNRDFVDQVLQEIDALTTAILADTGGSATAQFGWHSFSTETDDFIPGTGESPNTETAAFITKGNTIFSSPRTYYLDIPTAGYRWGYDVLGAKIAFAAEVPMRGNTSVAFYETIGENWVKTLQAVDADGVFYSSTTITASGAVQAQPATVSGAAERVIAGSGALSSSDGSVSGTAEREITAFGALDSQSASVSGSGGTAGNVTASGALQSQASSATGSATRVVTASGAAGAQPSTVAGSGVRTITASGVITAQQGSVSGSGELAGNINASGDIEAQPSTVSGTGTRTVTAQGALSAQAGTVAGSGESEGVVSGSGAAQAQAASVSGVALRIVTGSGSLQAQGSETDGNAQSGSSIGGSGDVEAQTAQVSGTATRTITGAGALQASSATTLGTARRTVVGSGAVAANDAQIEGAATRQVLGSGSLVAQASTINGFDIYTLSPVTFVVEADSRGFIVEQDIRTFAAGER